ncbi:hypothetical protein [Rugosimonospora acidiphila]|uniref:hypothetical protein n=1 Tax=Rugosimonospora acidiphila TaxID=556531 RepID=UPI0031EA29BA
MIIAMICRDDHATMIWRNNAVALQSKWLGCVKPTITPSVAKPAAFHCRLSSRADRRHDDRVGIASDREATGALR